MRQTSFGTLKSAVLTVSIATLTACGTQIAAPLTTNASISASLHTSLVAKTLFVADPFDNRVLMFPAGVQHGGLIGTITSGVLSPQALFVDSKGILYVTNARTVTEYQPGSSKPFRTLTGVSSGNAITVDSTGNVFVGNNCQIVPSGGTISVFAPGTTTPARTITLPQCSFMGGMTIDSSGNLVVSFFQYPAKIEHVLRFAPGSSTGTEITMLGVGTIDTTLRTDRAGNIYADGSSAAGEGVNVYAPGATSPTRSISAGMSSPTGIALDSTGNLYVANYPGPAGASFINVYAPGGSTPINTFSGNLTVLEGVAVRPAQ